MKKVVIVIVLVILAFLSHTKPVSARSCSDQYNASFAGGDPPSVIEYAADNQLTIQLTGLHPGEYYVKVVNDKTGGETRLEELVGNADSGGNLTINLTNPEAFRPNDDSTKLKIQLKQTGDSYCDLWKYRVTSDFDCTLNVTYNYDNPDNDPPTGTYENPSCYELDHGSMTFSVTNATMNGQPLTGQVYVGHDLTGTLQQVHYVWIDLSNGSGSASVSNNTLSGKKWVEDSSRFVVYYDHTEVVMCASGHRSFQDFCTLDDLEDDVPPGDGDTILPPFELCKNVPGDECPNCLDDGGIWTAVGCLHWNPKTFIADFLKLALGIAGGIALLLMIYGSFLVSTSAGDPKKSEEGKEIITGTIAGLLFIIFSAILLKLIGVEILSIPGL